VEQEIKISLVSQVFWGCTHSCYRGCHSDLLQDLNRAGVGVWVTKCI